MVVVRTSPLPSLLTLAVTAATPLQVERFAGPADEWDRFVALAQGGTCFHRAAWKPLLESLYQHECPYLVARDGAGALAGVLPLVRVRSRLFGHFLVSMPFVSYGGPLGSDAAVRALVAEAARAARQDGARLLELRSPHALPIDLPVSNRKLTVVLALDGGPAAVAKRLPSKLRSQTRRAAKEGVTYRFGPDCVDDFHRVYAHHMRDLGSPAQPLRFFRAIAAAFGDDVWFGCAYLGDVPIAGGAGFRSGSEFEITWASALRAWSRIAPNMGLYWAFIERAAEQGLSRFNFGRCSPGSATHRFKLQWGAVDEPLWWYQDSASGSVGTPSPDSPKFRLATAVWKRLPVGLTTTLSARIVPFIP
jgi:serine/alanine adding enzyme